MSLFLSSLGHPLVLILTFAIGIGLCQRSYGDGEAQVRNQLIPLRLKEVKRTDRLPHTGEKKTISDTPIASAPIDFEPGSEWKEEAFAEAARLQLLKLAKAEASSDVAGLLANNFQGVELATSSDKRDLGGGVTLCQGEGHTLTAMNADALWKELDRLGQLKLKIVRIEEPLGTTNQFSTEIRAEGMRNKTEYSATWSCQWEAKDKDRPPLLLSLQVKDFEIATSTGSWFSDATAACIGENPRFDAQVMHGIEYWAQRITRIGDLAMTGHHGIAVGDVNGDGLEDFYACDGGSLPNQLYLQQPDGTAREVAAEWGVAWLEDSRSALLVDLDNDGDQDLVVATIAMIAFAENNGAGKFLLRGGYPGAPYPFSLSAADFDSDGDLDIYTCVYSASDESASGKRGFEANSPIPFNDANNGGRNALLENLGEFKFTNVTEEIGLAQNNTRWSFAAAWEDYDRDGDPDLYVANDFGRNCLYRNDGGRFEEIAAETGVEDMAAGMSVAWSDFNRDGLADLYVGNMFSAAGHRIGYQRQFANGLQRMARGNSLFLARTDGFEDVSLKTGITSGGWAWSSAFADLNNDGWQDLVVANGYLTNTQDNDL